MTKIAFFCCALPAPKYDSSSFTAKIETMDKSLEDVITELDQYIASSKNRLNSILGALDWTIEDTLKERPCARKDEGNQSFCRNDPPLPESFGCTNSLIIEKPVLETIINNHNVVVPEKFSDIQLNFTRDQKCKIYDYVVANTAKTSEPELKVSLEDDDNAMTFAEIVAKAKKKDKKLRRKYRTSKPTHTEEVRNLVHLQMQALEKYFNPESEVQNYQDKNKPPDNIERSHNVDKYHKHKRKDKREGSSEHRTSSTEKKKRKSDRRDDDPAERHKHKRKKHKSPKSKHHHKHHKRH